jgi:AcrR family transcriptional regulator
MADTGTKTPRERYRAQVRAEIKERAREQIATAGASALSLNAIAKQMGMSGPALYRYFAGRDDLITELIRDAYRSLADTCRAAVEPEPEPETRPESETGPESEPETKTETETEGTADSAGPDAAAVAYAIRAWALADPQRYFLIYGTPVPGYHAPADTTAIVSEVMTVLLRVCANLPAGDEAGAMGGSAAGAGTGSPLDAALTGLGGRWADDASAPPGTLHRALVFWTRLHGTLSLELAGHFTEMGFDPELLFAAEVDALLGR